MELRKADFNDWAMLLVWRNDAETRNNSVDIWKIGEEEHTSWLQHLLQNENRQLFVALEDDVPVGTVRADYEPLTQQYELSWTVAPGMRGKGFGKHMVKLLASHIKGTVYARVKKSNVSSVRIAIFAGLQFIKEQEGILFYGRD
jgi:RimJ/RimL family protein N-acetyltransferase